MVLLCNLAPYSFQRRISKFLYCMFKKYFFLFLHSHAQTVDLQAYPPHAQIQRRESDTCTLLSTMKDKGYFCIFGHTCKPSSTHLHQQQWTQRTHYGNDQAFANTHTLPGTLVSSVLFLHMFTLQQHLGRKANEVYYNDDDDSDDASLSIIHHVKR